MSTDFQRKVTFRLLEDEDLQRIHGYSMQLLAENGVKFPNERALEVFRSHGYRIEGQQVYFTEKQVMDALATAPSHFVIEGRNPDRKLDLGGGDYGVAGPIGPVNIVSLDEPARPGTLADVENLVKIYQASKVMTMNSNNGVEANDVDVDNRHLMVTRALLRNTDKPVYTRLFDYRQMHEIMDMIEIAVGDKLEKGGRIYLSAGSTPSISPLSWSTEVLDNIIALAERGQVVTTGTATSRGITGPILPFGTVIVQNAEVLSGIVLAQLVNPGNPVGYGTAATPGNMRGAKSAFGSPGITPLQIASLEMGQRFYHLPSRTEAYSTDSPNIDVQCGIESYESTYGNTLSGADYMLSEIGTLSGLMTTSLEKTIIDEEITSRLIHMHNGFDVSDESASIDEILETGSAGTYITSDNTLEYMMDDWYPSVTDWNSKADDRPAGDYEYVLRRANAEWKRRLEEAPDCMLDEGTAKALDEYVNKHLR